MSILSTDFHTHILPGIDDGSKSVDESLEMLRKERADGIDTVLLTPHFYPHQMYPDSFLKNRESALDELNQALTADFQAPKMITGAEVLYYPGMSHWDQLELLTLGDSNYILIEIPFSKWGDATYAELARIRNNRDLIPIIAHIERSVTRFNMHRVLSRLSELSVLAQINCEFLIDKHTQGTALKLLAEQKVHLIGSDCHRIEWRSPNMEQANEIILSNTDTQTRSFLISNQKLILQK